jgi:hypothetical protein
MNTDNTPGHGRPVPQHPEDPHLRQTEIIVNGRERTVVGNEVTFEEVTKLAFPGPDEANVIYTVTFKNADQHPSAGELTASGTVEAKNRTIFNVTRTVKS